VAVKFEIGTKLYEAGKYKKAIRLLSKLHPHRGKPQAEKLFYMFSQAYYKTEQYYLAGYQFESFASGYPKVKSTGSCLFRSEELFYVVTYL
jgi:outer membrane protein assembly factor BamD